MRRYLLFTCVFLLNFSQLLNAQTVSKTETKLDLRLWNALNNKKIKQKNVALLVKGNTAEIASLTERLGGSVKVSYDNISSVVIPVNNLSVFAQSEFIEKIENTHVRGTNMMDTARIRNNIDSVHRGFAPLIDSLKGKGVIVGILDGGIYWQHGDFRNPADSTTRIRYIWDQAVSGSNAPLPYQYGNQWSWIDINNGNCNHAPPANDFGHGTCVAGIAAGNSLSTRGTPYENQLTGVAPESDIIAVRVAYGNSFLSNVVDAVDYVFKKADALGMPCVINTSLGTYYGSHDGIDLTTQMIEAMLDAKKGRVLVAAAGNAGNIPHHLSYQIPADSAFTFFKYNTSAQEVYFDLWADTADFANAYFAVGCNDTFGISLGRTEYFNAIADFNPPPGSGIIISRNLFGATSFLGQVQIQTTLDEGRYHIEFLIAPSNTQNLWRLQTKGSGTFDLWSSSSLIGSADMTSYVKTGDTTTPEVLISFPAYRHPDSLKTMVSSWQNSDKIITVGNYSGRAGYLDRDSVYQDMTAPPNQDVVGKKYITSSFGPTRDNRVKPDVMATGSTTIATGDAGFIATATSAANRLKVYITKKHIRNGGTSMASPVVAGIAALYLQKRPTATYDEIRKVLIWTAVQDSFTGSTPNDSYGNGKVNAFQALTYAGIIYGASDTSCINFNPLANVDSLGCEAKVYGCMDSTADNYNPLANVSDGNCTYSVGLTESADASKITVSPNPFSRYTVFEINDVEFTNGSLSIYNQSGQLVDRLALAAGKTKYIYQNPKLSKGLYYYHVAGNNHLNVFGKLVIE